MLFCNQFVIHEKWTNNIISSDPCLDIQFFLLGYCMQITHPMWIFITTISTIVMINSTVYFKCSFIKKKTTKLIVIILINSVHYFVTNLNSFKIIFHKLLSGNNFIRIIFASQISKFQNFKNAAFMIS